MRLSNIVFVVAALAALAGCGTIAHQKIDVLKQQEGRTRVLLMPVDVELSELTAAGLPEPKAEWTEAAREHLRSALIEEQAARGIALVSFAPTENGEADETVDQLLRLHRAVGEAILTYQYGLTTRLPTKRGHFDWSLGPTVRILAEGYGAEYALFATVRDSYAGWGRRAFMLAAAVFGIPALGGTQSGYVSLVDLETGDIVWFNRLLRVRGDLRTPDAARETARLLLEGLPS